MIVTERLRNCLNYAPRGLVSRELCISVDVGKFQFSGNEIKPHYKLTHYSKKGILY